ncbi:hypothetical protein BV22DRAFT_844515 [Leucogyrophana mollusca]|uniref:Uncharacterized protein n=1 Tax=Leucogyrophana mollusca TaxID=85980 RepID=A0ACB8B1Z6_9AGAM|nr:hypothetical protein BV22DRAFT_844515 [Leucogyrophana mollusca]
MQAARTAVDQRQCESCRAQVGKLSGVACLPPAATRQQKTHTFRIRGMSGAVENEGVFHQQRRAPSIQRPTQMTDMEGILERPRTRFDARQAKQPPNETVTKMPCFPPYTPTSTCTTQPSPSSTTTARARSQRPLLPAPPHLTTTPPMPTRASPAPPCPSYFPAALPRSPAPTRHTPPPHNQI